MRPTVISLALAIMGLVGLPGAASAQRPLSLAEAQAEARARAPEAAELRARIAGAEAIAAQAGRVIRDDPSVAGSIFRGSVIGKPEESTWDISLKQAFDLSGSWKPRAASAAADVSRARFDGEDGLRALDERVAVAVADVALAQRLVTRMERISELQRLATDAARRQFEVGTAPQIDADAAALDLAGSLMALEQARGDLNRSRMQLARVLGRETGRDLIVEDAIEPMDVPQAPDFSVFVDRDARVRSAGAELDAAKAERQTYERLVMPPVTFGLDYGQRRTDIPTGAFTGAPFASSLTANWSDADLVFSASMAVPLFNRQREPRARATARMLAAEARLLAVRVNVRSELASAWSDLQAAARAYQSVATTSTIVDRDVTFVEQAVQAGQFDTTTRTLALRRLEDAGRRIDTAIRELRVARAAWVRRTQGLP